MFPSKYVSTRIPYYNDIPHHITVRETKMQLSQFLCISSKLCINLKVFKRKCQTIDGNGVLTNDSYTEFPSKNKEAQNDFSSLTITTHDHRSEVWCDIKLHGEKNEAQSKTIRMLMLHMLPMRSVKLSHLSKMRNHHLQKVKEVKSYIF